MASMLKSLKLLADPTRLRILMLLEQEALSVAELQEILGMGQSRISTQLSQMKTEGLVEDERSGKNNIYSCSATPDLLEVARLAAQEVREVEKDSSALRHLLSKRKDASRAYFDELAGRFGRDYVPGRSWKGLAEAMLRVLNYRVVADLGAGEGTLSQLLARRAEKVIAVDLSPKMVEFGRELAVKHGLPNLEYRLGDIEEPPIENASVDLAILSQALHHAEHPQRALEAAFRILKPSGRLIVLDLLQHTFEEARELYADRWLGFAESDLATMLEKAGFSGVETTVADREASAPGFQTLLGVGWRE
ncbi:metalloregulator ArsR/SmtB family transcription factor [Luteolibacter ambystomatis]|uniref:Metalloregulator ArsR/SmtB family transcription factor n=1 Tax=Luteolibacter ambystomatis TaxID=2824561 RepID=A0A975J075_9BACT|nr:metalloregulator ArsR/SmtB family transcription factor [Luteolibacter ambystomatis]QUE51613.1 metalloregulator ArsR/SmtB family transcription factor [Luteolibacter ambystomatis]